jgi:hypothetical protein
LVCGATPTIWASGCIASTFGFYRDWGLGAAAELLEERHPQSLQGLSLIRSRGQIPVPAAIARAHVRYPLAFIDRAYADLRQFTDMPGVGQFPTMETPHLLVEDYSDSSAHEEHRVAAVQSRSHAGP